MAQKIDQLAESAVLKVMSRICAVILTMIMGWAGMSLSSLNTNMAVALQEISQHDKRITSLETWRNDHRAGNFFVGAVLDSPHRD